jgi:hypothetical protein
MLMRIHPVSSTNKRGSASLIVIVLLIAMAILINANSRALHDLNQNLRRIEEKQLRHSDDSDGTNRTVKPSTNVVVLLRAHE